MEILLEQYVIPHQQNTAVLELIALNDDQNSAKSRSFGALDWSSMDCLFYGFPVLCNGV